MAQNSVMLDGSYLGHILYSIQNETGNLQPVVIVPDSQHPDSVVQVHIGDSEKALTFVVATPVVLYGGVRRIRYVGGPPIRLQGENIGTSGASLTFTEESDIFAASATFDCETVTFASNAVVRLEAPTITDRGRLAIVTKPGAQIGLGGGFLTHYPWTTVTSSLAMPPPPEGSPVGFVGLIRLMADGFNGPVNLADDYGPPDGDPKYAHFTNHYTRDEFRWAVRLIVNEGLATSETYTSSGVRQHRVRFKHLTELKDVAMERRGVGQVSSPKVAEAISKVLRQGIDRMG